MDFTSIPPTAFIALGVITAALLTGVFSIMNMVSAKENKVSEFRLAWIDGLREEIAEYSSAAQELSRAYNPDRFSPLENHSQKEAHELQIELHKETRDAYARAVENLTKIQLRLNPAQIEKGSGTPEAKLMDAVKKARKAGRQNFTETLQICDEIRSAAAPILKSTWNSVKLGEPAYRRFRWTAIIIVLLGFSSILLGGSYIGYSSYKTQELKERKELLIKLSDAAKRLSELNQNQTTNNK